MSTDGKDDDDSTGSLDEPVAPRPRNPLSTRNWILVVVMMAIAAGVPSLMQTMKSDRFKEQSDHVLSAFQSAQDGCRETGGPRLDVCIAEAVVERERGLADIDTKRNGSPKSREDAANRVSRVEYLASRERCKLFDGAAANACYSTARADLLAKRGESRAERVEQRAAMRTTDQQNAAAYWVEVAKCDGESGRVKYECQMQAKIRFHQ